MLRAFHFRLGTRLYSVKPAKKDANKYTDTINLPRTRFPTRLSAAKREEQERQILDVSFYIKKSSQIVQMYQMLLCSIRLRPPTSTRNSTSVSQPLCCTMGRPMPMGSCTWATPSTRYSRILRCVNVWYTDSRLTTYPAGIATDCPLS